MSEATEKTDASPEQTRAVAVRERLVTQAPVAIWDTADFEQMQRVGVVLARSGLVPESLCKQGDEWLPEPVVAARCVLICNQARLWGADPLNVLQCTSLINGRLMYEGKLVNAIVQHLTGVKLRFELGRWDADHFVAVPREELSGLGERLAIRCFDPADEHREVTGSAGMWKTTRAGSPWSNAGNWPRQLRYRAAREWARAYEPGAILGILAEGDEEIDFSRPEEPRGPGVMSRLPGNQHAEGFDGDNGAATTEAARASVRGKRAARKAAQEALPAPQEDPPAAEEPSAAQPDPEAQTAAEAAAEAIDGDDLPDTVKQAPEVAAPEEDAVSEGYPEPDEIYHLTGDEWEPGENGPKRQSYKDGVTFSMHGRGSGLSIYEDHRPEGAMTDDADAEGLAGASEAQDALDAEEQTTLPPEMQTFISAVDTATTFVQVKAAMADFFKTEMFKGLKPDQQNHIRYQTWATLTDRKEAGDFNDLPDHAADVSAFRLWIEAQEDAEAIQGTLSVLERQPAFGAAAEATQAAVRAAAAARIADLG